jgi:hypothetical protein
MRNSQHQRTNVFFIVLADEILLLYIIEFSFIPSNKLVVINSDIQRWKFVMHESRSLGRYGKNICQSHLNPQSAKY